MIERFSRQHSDIERGGKQRHRIGFCCPSHNKALEIENIAVNSLQRLGFDVMLCKEGDPKILNTDRILLIGMGYNFPIYEKLFSQHKQKRPEVFLWQFEPAPMPGLSNESIYFGKKMVESNFDNLSPFWNRLTKALVPNRHVIRNLYWKFLLGKFRKTLSQDQLKAYSQMLTSDVADTMRKGIRSVEHYNSDWCDNYILSTPPRVEFFREKGIDAYYAPVGWHEIWGEPMQLDRDIDVLFIGSLKGCRKKLVTRLRSQLLEIGLDLFIAKGYYGQERTNLLNRCKIVLDVDRLGWELPIMRMLAAMPCGALVITSWTGDPTPFSKNHLVQTSLENFPQAAQYYLKNPSEREKITANARAFVLKTLTMQNMLDHLLNKRKSWDGKNLKMAVRLTEKSEDRI